MVLKCMLFPACLGDRGGCNPSRARLVADAPRRVQWIPEHEADVAVLEEPEHLNWYQHGRRWTDKFNHVVGIMHTNYLDYARREENGKLKALLLGTINSWVCRAHTHKVIKLSDAVQRLPRECTQFVHGVSPQFLEVGAEKSDAYTMARDAARAGAAEPGAKSKQVWPRGAYFLGKLVWGKGYTELLDLLEHHKKASGFDLPLEIYGHGDDEAVRVGLLRVELVPLC
jgi:digalactosyldiacylglycerol synthase